MGEFEGYIGIQIGENQLANDIIFSLLLGLLLIFAIVFRTHLNLFRKMLKDTIQLKERGSLFEQIAGNEFIFGRFMTFQTLFLCSIGLFLIGRIQGYMAFADITWLLLTIVAVFILLSLYYIFKQGIYYLLGFIFAEPEKFKLWKTNYHALMSLWGVLLYIPVIWLMFTGSRYMAPILMFVFLYFLCRFVIIYNSIRIFFSKKHGFLYISLYLCTQEIIPLIMLYQGLVFLYNFIEASTLWH